MCMDGIACCSCYIAYYGPLLTHQGIQQGRFPNIWLAHYGYTGYVRRSLFGVFVNFFYHLIEDLTCTATRHGGKKKYMLKTQLIKLLGFQISCVIIYFINSKKYGLLRSSQYVCHCLIKVSDAGGAIHHKYDSVGFLYSNHYLFTDLAFKYVFAVGNKSTRVN